MCLADGPTLAFDIFLVHDNCREMIQVFVQDHFVGNGPEKKLTGRDKSGEN